MRKVFRVICFFGMMAGAVNAQDNVRLISVTGSSEKSFQPDIVRLNITVWGKGDSAKKAQANNQTNYDLLKKAVEKFKIKKEDIRTTSYELNPEYVYDQKTNKNNISGY
ncbi:MAG: SIMPL domain-containing protein, partial [Bdellovibrionales bacterium]|nr:SIMPL domain-containing protein [Bdellovibrionales bacterium]